MASGSIGSCAGSPPKRSHFREEKKISPNTSDRRGCRKNDICYHCKEEGHWAMDCPNKRRNNPVSSPNKAFPKFPQKYPELPCRICGQPCIVRTSRSDKNPGRDFYTCAFSVMLAVLFRFYRLMYEENGFGSQFFYFILEAQVRGSTCNMFQWCDELGKSRPRGLNSPVKSVQHRGAAMLQNPACSCTAGPCRVETKRNGHKCFVCHLKSRQGPCVHSKRCDGLGDDVYLNHNLMTEELKNTGTNNHQEIKEKKDEEIVIPPPPLPLAELEAESVGVGSSPLKRLNFMEGSPSKRKRIEELTSERVSSPSLNYYLNEEPNNLETNKGAVGNRDDTDSGETLVQDSPPTPPPTGNSARPECSPMKRLSLNECNWKNPKKCVFCEEVGHVVTECPDLAIMLS